MSILDKAIAQLQSLKIFEVDIRRALVYGEGTHTFDDVCAMVLSGRLDVHVLDGAVILAEVVRYPQYTAYNVFVAAGKLEPILEAQRSYLIREAQKRGASKLSFTGRKGWQRVLENEGWSANLIAMAKEVPNGEIKDTRDRAEHRQGAGEGSEKLVRHASPVCEHGIQPLHG